MWNTLFLDPILKFSLRYPRWCLYFLDIDLLIIATVQGCCTNTCIMNAIIKVSDYQGNATPDKQGKMPVFCSPVAGAFPRSMMVLAGSSAEMYGFEVNKTYAVSVNDTNRRREYQTHDGRNGISKVWAVTNLGEISSPIEIIQATSLIGDVNVVDDVLIGDEIIKAQQAKEEPVVEQ